MPYKQRLSAKGLIADAKKKLKINKNRDASALSRRTVEYRSPADSMGKAEIIIGTCLRALVMFCAVFGLALMLFDAVGIYKQNHDFREYSLPVFPLVLIAAVFSFALVFIKYSKVTKLAVPSGLALLLAGLPALLYGNPFTLYENSVRMIWNESIDYIASRRFTSLARLALADGYSYDRETLMIWGAVAICAALSLVMYFALCDKTRPLLFALVYFVWLTPLFIFNLPSSNIGFAFSASAIFGFIALFTCDRRFSGYHEKKQAKKEARRKKREDRKSLSVEKKLTSVRIRSAASAVYEKAIEASMTEKKARSAAVSVVKRLKAERREAAKRDRLDIKIRKKEDAKRLKEEKKAKKAQLKNIKKELKSRDASALSAEAAEYKARIELQREGRKEARKRKFALHAASGFTSAAALALALLAIWIPSAAAKKSFKQIPFIDEKVRQLRQYTDDLLMSDDVDLTRDDLYSYPEVFGYEKLTFDERKYEGTLIYYAESATKSNLYLKTRTALDFNLSSDTWSFADNEKVIETSRYFSDKFTPDSITSGAYALLYPSSGDIPAKSTYSIFSRYGFTVQQLHLLRINGDSKLLAVPSVINPDIGLLKRGKDEAADHEYTPYFDGIYTSRYYGTDSEGYSTVSFIYDMKREDIGAVLEAESVCFDAMSVLADKYKKGSDATELKAEYKASFDAEGLYFDLGEIYVDEMTDEERSEVDSLLETERKYREWVGENYTAQSGSEEISALARTLCDGKETRHEKVMAVIGYLTGSDFTYTLSPVSPEESEKGVLETFLFDTKEGYCNHFTTAAALLLRDAGVPVRYAEGYLARGWFDGYGNHTVAKYTSNVFDENSHTWIEVYYDGIGWIPYETTPLYAEEMYGADKKPSDEETVVPEDESDGLGTTDRVIEKLPTIIPEPEEEVQMSVLEKFRWLIIAVSCVIVLYIAYGIVSGVIKKRAMAIVDNKYKMIADARNEAVFRDKSRDKKEIEEFLIDNVLMILKEVGIGPEKGELSETFGKRLKKDFGGISTIDPEVIMGYIRKSEFGGRLSFTELSELAEFLADITVSLYSGLSPIKKFRLRYVKHVI